MSKVDNPMKRINLLIRSSWSWLLPGHKHNSGASTVADVNEDKYLVDLDEQEAQLWEKAWGLKKA